MERSLETRLLQKRLRDLRNNAGMTIEQLSERINVSPRSISYWEKGEKDPSASNVASISTVFGVSADYLLGIEENGNMLSPQLREPSVLDVVTSIEDMSIRKLVVMSHREELSKSETKVLLGIARALLNAKKLSENK